MSTKRIAGAHDAYESNCTNQIFVTDDATHLCKAEEETLKCTNDCVVTLDEHPFASQRHRIVANGGTVTLHGGDFPLLGDPITIVNGSFVDVVFDGEDWVPDAAGVGPGGPTGPTGPGGPTGPAGPQFALGYVEVDEPTTIVHTDGFVTLLTVPITVTQGNALKVHAYFSAHTTDGQAAGNKTGFQILIDGVPLATKATITSPAPGSSETGDIEVVRNVAPGAHTVDLQWVAFLTGLDASNSSTIDPISFEGASLLVEECLYNPPAFSPPDATSANLSWWLKSDAGVTLAVGNKVSAWLDQSGNGNNITQADSAHQPTLDPASENGRDAILTDQLNPDFLEITGGTFPAAAGEFFIVMRNIADNETSPFVLGTSGQDTLLPFTGVGTEDCYDDCMSTARKGPATSPTLLTALHIYSVRSKTLAWSNYVNASQLLSTAVNTFGLPATKRIGAGTAPGATAHFCEILMYDDVLSPTDRTAVMNYLAARWNIPLE